MGNRYFCHIVPCVLSTEWKISMKHFAFPPKHRYHFNLSDGDMLLPDPKGIDLPDNEAALRHAELLAGGFKWIRWSICVSDEEGNTIANIG